MEDRILSTKHGQYELAVWDGVNYSGIKPVGDFVLVLCDQAMSETKGGIVITDTTKEQQDLSGTTGLTVAVGEAAFLFNSDRLVKWLGERPQPGDRVYFQRYSGQEYTGNDGRLYRLMQDKCIAGIELPLPPVVIFQGDEE
jgi:chaperonin GroES